MSIVISRPILVVNTYNRKEAENLSFIRPDNSQVIEIKKARPKRKLGINEKKVFELKALLPFDFTLVPNKARTANEVFYLLKRLSQKPQKKEDLDNLQSILFRLKELDDENKVTLKENGFSNIYSANELRNDPSKIDCQKIVTLVEELVSKNLGIAFIKAIKCKAVEARNKEDFALSSYEHVATAVPFIFLPAQGRAYNTLLGTYILSKIYSINQLHNRHLYYTGKKPEAVQNFIETQSPQREDLVSNLSESNYSSALEVLQEILKQFTEKEQVFLRERFYCSGHQARRPAGYSVLQKRLKIYSLHQVRKLIVELEKKLRESIMALSPEKKDILEQAFPDIVDFDKLS